MFLLSGLDSSHCVRARRDFAPAGEFLSFVGPKERNQRKGPERQRIWPVAYGKKKRLASGSGGPVQRASKTVGEYERGRGTAPGKASNRDSRERESRREEETKRRRAYEVGLLIVFYRLLFLALSSAPSSRSCLLLLLLLLAPRLGRAAAPKRPALHQPIQFLAVGHRPNGWRSGPLLCLLSFGPSNESRSPAGRVRRALTQ